ncbi:SMR family transporter [Actinomyces sp. Marseille-P3109]|uniref:DMT family transporter n=1 Tax=Actinomyces sp. Marseille-P3109 TaxID=2083009 RepID=UPI001900DF82
MTVKGALCPSTWGSACRRSAPTDPTVLGALGDRLRSTSHGVCAWPALGGAIVSEVSATLALRQALNQPGFYAVVGIGYALAFVLLSLTLKAGMPLGVAYGLWGALGVALTAVLSMILFEESVTVLVAVGIALIMAGVLLVEIGAQRAEAQQKDGKAS